MHYECKTAFVATSREVFRKGERIPENVYKAMTDEEKKNFIGLVDESIAEEFDDLNRRESKLENE